ncbi:MAG: hypothetical protein J6R52_04810 [Alphaproteobacteria bacterium]|nr:hypothetical protein [Alphaproteobacteria bacterium]
MLTRIEYSKGPHPSLFQINYVLGNDYLTLLGLKEYCSDVDSTARYIAGMYQIQPQTQTMTPVEMETVRLTAKELYDAINSERI